MWLERVSQRFAQALAAKPLKIVNLAPNHPAEPDAPR
jgi:hypothetical protein